MKRFVKIKFLCLIAIEEGMSFSDIYRNMEQFEVYSWTSVFKSLTDLTKEGYLIVKDGKKAHSNEVYLTSKGKMARKHARDFWLLGGRYLYDKEKSRT